MTNTHKLTIKNYIPQLHTSVTPITPTLTITKMLLT